MAGKQRVFYVLDSCPGWIIKTLFSIYHKCRIPLFPTMSQGPQLSTDARLVGVYVCTCVRQWTV